MTDAGGPTDTADPQPVVARRTVFHGRVWDVRQDEVELTSSVGGDGEVVVREYIEHPGAVGIIALDAADRVLLIRQYRHPARAMLWEPPAGLLDVDGEPPLLAAQRELLEEAHHVADRWDVLYDVLTTPGSSSEALRCFLARDVRPADGERFVGEGEERAMEVRWVGLDDLVGAVLAGRLRNPTTVTGALAAYAARAVGWSTLRRPDAPFPDRPGRGQPAEL